MKCQGNFVFKTLTHRASGVFKDAEGNEVSYPAAYILKVDELSSSEDINERKFKIDEKNLALINDLKTFKPYQKIMLDFEVTLFTNRIGLEVVKVSTFDEYDD